MKNKPRPKPRHSYSLLSEMMASPTEPLPQFRIDTQLAAMWTGLSNLEEAEAPMPNDWRVCSDAVNLLETLVHMGEVEDTQGLLNEAVAELGACGKLAIQGQGLRLSGTGIPVVRAVLEDYRDVIQALPARTMIRAHRLTERRLHEIQRGKRQSHDVVML